MIMKKLIILAALALPMAASADPTCLPSVLALSTAPIGTMWPGKSPDRPALLKASPDQGLGAIWWCGDGTVWEYHVTTAALASKWGTPRDLQAAYVAGPAAMRSSVGPSCFGASAECYPIPGGKQICGNALITEVNEKALCTALLKQAASEWPR